MLVFADNDILIKLAGCSLLERFLVALDNPEICIARTTRFSLPKQAKKKIKDQTRVSDLCSWITGVADASAVNDVAILDRLSAIPGIDSGEGTLFASMCESTDVVRLVTGDRRSLRALLANQTQLSDVVERLSGTVYTLESALLLLIEQYGFAEIDETMKARAVEDMVIDMAFGPGRSSDHAKQCLSSSTRDVLPLLANPSLVLPVE